MLTELGDRNPPRGHRPRLRRPPLVGQVADELLELPERLRGQRRLDTLVELDRVQPPRLRVPLQRTDDPFPIVVPGA